MIDRRLVSGSEASAFLSTAMKKILLTLALILVAVSCSRELLVYSDWDRDYDLSTFHSFSWAPNDYLEQTNNPLYYNELNDKRIKTSVNHEMFIKGYQLVTDHPQLVIHYHIIVNDKTALTPDPYGHYYSPYWIQRHMSAYQYSEGTLIIDLMDSDNKHLIWRGWAVSTLEKIRGREDVEDLIQQAVKEIMTAFPAAVNWPDEDLRIIKM